MEECRSRGDKSALIVTRRGPSELSHGFMAFWFAQRFPDGGASSHKGFLMAVWFAQYFSHGCFGSRSGFLIAHQLVPTNSFFSFVLASVLLMQGGDCIASMVVRNRAGDC